jgi:glycerol transport system ATP-binding protein
VNATTARVFSDPPMNFLRVSKAGSQISFGEGQSLPTPAGLKGQPDGAYTAGFRPNHLELNPKSAGAMTFKTTLSVTEITGSETFVHLDHDGQRWVGLVHGIQSLTPGQPLEVFLDPAHVYIFGQDGQLVSTAPYSEVA